MAHLLTGIRLLAVAPAAWAFSRPNEVSPWLPAALVAVAVATDHFDGIVARRSGRASPAGMLFDHATDFLFVAAGLAGAAFAGLVPIVLPVLVTAAFTQYVLDSYLLHRDAQLRMSRLGRWNGLLYFLPLVLLAFAGLRVPGPWAGWAAALVRPIAWLLVVSTIASMADRALAPTGPRARASVAGSPRHR